MQFAERIQYLTGSAGREILALCEQRSVVSFAGGLPGSEAWEGIEFPPLAPDAYQYGPSEGDRALRDLFARQMGQMGVPVDWQQVLVTSGSQQGLDLVAKLWIDPGTTVAVESPTYMAALQVFRLFQSDLHCIPVTRDGLDPEALERCLSEQKPRLLYLNPTFQNPSGHCYPTDNRRALAAVLDRYAHQTVLIEDDPYRFLSYGEAEPPAPIVRYLTKARWVYLGTTSKILMPGARIGYLAASPEFLPHLIKLKQAADLHSSRLSQHIVLELLGDASWLQQRACSLRTIYATKRNCMQQVLQAVAADLADWELPEGGMFFWLRIKQPIDLKSALQQAVRTGVAFMPGDSFFSSPIENGRWVRLNFTAPTHEEVVRCLPIVLQALRDHRIKHFVKSNSKDNPTAAALKAR